MGRWGESGEKLDWRWMSALVLQVGGVDVLNTVTRGYKGQQGTHHIVCRIDVFGRNVAQLLDQCHGLHNLQYTAVHTFCTSPNGYPYLAWL